MAKREVYDVPEFIRSARESDIEKYLEREVKALGAFCRKLRWIGRNGAPDRIVIYKGAVYFIELKAPSKRLDPLQVVEHERMRAAGAKVFINIDSIDKVDLIVTTMREFANV